MTVGALDIEVGANFARFASDMGRIVSIAEDTGRRIQSSFDSVGNGIRSILQAAGVGIGIEAFREMITSSIEAKARLFDLATQTGITVEALGALRNVGALTRTSIDDIALASARLSKAVQTQNADSTGAAQAIKALGLNFAAFKQLNADDQLLAVAKAMALAHDGTEKEAASMLLYGRNGASLLSFLRDLAVNQQLQSKQSLESATRAKELDDNLVKLKTASSELKDELIGNMVPALVSFTQQMLEAKTGSEKLGVVWENIKRNLGVDAFGIQVLKVKELNAEVKNAGSALDASVALAGSFPGAAGLFAPLVEANRKSLDQLRAQSAQENEILKGMRDRTAVQAPAQPSFHASDNYGPGYDSRPKLKDLDDKANQQVSEQERFLQSLRKQLEAQEQGRNEALLLEATTKHLSATQLTEATKIIGALEQHDAMLRQIKSDTESLDKAEDQRNKIIDFVTSGNDLSKALIDQVEPLRLAATEQAKYTELKKLDDITTRALIGATSDTRVEILKLADTMRTNLVRSFDELEAAKKRAQADPSLGAKRAIQAYSDQANDLAGQVEGTLTDAFKGAEDALVSFATTGKLNFKSLADSIIADLVRIQVKSLFFGGAQGTIGASFGGGSGLAGFFESLFGSGGVAGHSSSDISALFGPDGYGAAGINYVPYDGYRAILHAGEQVKTKAEVARGAASASSQPLVLQPTYHFGSNVSPQDVAAAVQIGNAQLKKDLYRSTRRGGAFAAI